MVKFIVLDQAAPVERIQRQLKIVKDHKLWKRYLDELCTLRGKVYIDEGLYSKEILSDDGKFVEQWDPFSMHTIAVDEGKVVGALRVTLMLENGRRHKCDIDELFKRLHLKKHTQALQVMLDKFARQNRKVIEISRLVVAEEYRRFRNVKSKASIGLFTVTYSYFLGNGVNDVFIVQGNKYKTGRIYEKMGFTQIKDVEKQQPLEHFYDFDDICTFMHFDTSEPSEILKKFINGMKNTYLDSTIIVKQG